MRLPASRYPYQPTPYRHDDGEIDITIHLHHKEIIERDVTSLVEVFNPTDDDACRDFLRSIRGRVRLVPEEDTHHLFLNDNPGLAVHGYLRALHDSTPLWPWLFAPGDPWVLLTAWANTRGAVWFVHRSTARANCAFPRSRLYQFLEQTRSRFSKAAQAAGLTDDEWRKVFIGLAERILPLATDARRLRMQ